MNRFKKKLLYSYLIVLHLVVVLLLVLLMIKPNQKMIWHIAQVLGLVEQPSVQKIYQSTLTTFYNRVDRQINKPYDLFIGASLIQGFYTQSLTSRSINFGIGGDTSEDVLNRLQTYQSLDYVQTLVLQVGGNDLKSRSLQDIEHTLSQLQPYLHKAQQVLWLGVLPFDLAMQPERNNRLVIELNKKIQTRCGQLSNCTYLQPDKILYNDQGGLSTSYHTGDGIHLNKKGYEIWREQLRPWFRPSAITDYTNQNTTKAR